MDSAGLVEDTNIRPLTYVLSASYDSTADVTSISYQQQQAGTAPGDPTLDFSPSGSNSYM